MAMTITAARKAFIAHAESNLLAKGVDPAKIPTIVKEGLRFFDMLIDTEKERRDLSITVASFGDVPIVPERLEQEGVELAFTWLHGVIQNFLAEAG